MQLTNEPSARTLMSPLRWRPFAAGAAAVLLLSTASAAQPEQVEQPPPGGGAAPPGQPPPAAAPQPYPATGYPPPGYPPPGYYPPPPERPKTLHYQEGQPIPPGYYLDEGPIKGLVISGSIVLGVFYGLALMVASADGFPNESHWLAVPVAGPFITMAAREDRCDEDAYALDCVSDAMVRTYLIMDGIGQVAGATLLTVGLASTRRRLVRQDIADLTVAPARVGSGYGLSAFGRF